MMYSMYFYFQIWTDTQTCVAYRALSRYKKEKQKPEFFLRSHKPLTGYVIRLGHSSLVLYTNTVISSHCWTICFCMTVQILSRSFTPISWKTPWTLTAKDRLFPASWAHVPRLGYKVTVTCLEQTLSTAEISLSLDGNRIISQGSTSFSCSQNHIMYYSTYSL